MKKNRKLIVWTLATTLVLVVLPIIFVVRHRVQTAFVYRSEPNGVQPAAFVDTRRATGTGEQRHDLIEVQSDIDKVLRESCEGINRGDVDAYIADLSTDYKWNSPEGQMLTKEELAKTVRQDLTVSKNMHVIIEITSMKIRDEAAEVDYRKTLKFDLPNLRNSFTFDTPSKDQMEKRNGKWEVISTKILSKRASYSPM